jgi:hypothetical protein
MVLAPGGKPDNSFLMDNQTDSSLRRWLTGPRFTGLPMRGADLPPPKLSFEFFPPRTEALEQQLWTCITRLAPLCPRFVSVTYGAGGTTQARTHATVTRLLHETDLTPAAHLTCVGATTEAVDNVARQYWDAGVRHIVALRGDAPPGQTYEPHPGGYAYAADLETRSASWMPARRAPSPGIFSIPRSIRASWTCASGGDRGADHSRDYADLELCTGCKIL